MRSLLIQIDARETTCGNCHRLHVSEDLDKAHRGTCGVFQVGLIRRVSGEFDRVAGCLNAERVSTEKGASAA